MPNPFDNAIAVGLRFVKQAAGRTVRYSRGAHAVDLVAIPGESREMAYTREDLRVTMRVRDYLVTASELILAAAATKPQTGDIITDTLGGIEKRFVVKADDGGNCFRYSDSARTVYRIHTEER